MTVSNQFIRIFFQWNKEKSVTTYRVMLDNKKRFTMTNGESFFIYIPVIFNTKSQINKKDIMIIAIDRSFFLPKAIFTIG